MLHVIYCEFSKLKKSYLYVVLLAVALFFPVLLLVGWTIQGAHVTWNKYLLQIEQISVLFLNLSLFAMTAAYIFTREYSYNTAHSLFCYPAGRIKIFISKVVVTIAVSSATLILQLGLGILGGLVLQHEPLTISIITGHLRMTLFILIYECAILPIAILIALLSKNVIMPVVYGGFVSVLILITSEIRSISIETLKEYVPFFYPIQILFNSIRGSDLDPSGYVLVKSGVYLYAPPCIIALSVFVVGLLSCILYYSKTDIN